MSGAVVNCTETGEDNLSAKSSGVSPIGLGLYIQRIAGWICLIPLSILIIALLRLRGRHRILRHAEIRRLFKEYTLTQEPLIICANHLTLIDSVIILWALASTYTYVCHYRLFCWNLPAVENTKKRISWRVITYLSKCILIDRLGDAQHTNFRLGQICSLLRNRDLFLLFPEGTRSRDGRINPQSVTYGIGKILQQVPECRVVCVYLRGH
ncbi:MAG: hypothetical protein DCC75_09760, partial [Proteobacteria bacterium]